jgi:hypothetical protein
MKTLTCAVVLLAFMGLLLIDCSDPSQSPVSPKDQTIQSSTTIQKNFSRDFNAIVIPTGIFEEPIIKYPDGKTLQLHFLGPIQLTATFSDGLTDLLSGTGVIEISGIQDQVTGKGHIDGKVTVTPDNAEGGVWKFTWHGEPAFNPTVWNGGPGWVLPLKEIGHGNGGNINGMQCIWENTITGPLDWSTWAGSGPGQITSH